MAEKPQSIEKVLDTVRKLVTLAQDDTEEGRNAARKAMVLMKEHRIALVPESELERAQKTLREARELAAKVQGEANQKLVVGVLLGSQLGKGKLF
jgi:hypothetical protein